jgi:hypothetical protein
MDPAVPARKRRRASFHSERIVLIPNRSHHAKATRVRLTEIGAIPSLGRVFGRSRPSYGAGVQLARDLNPPCRTSTPKRRGELPPPSFATCDSRTKAFFVEGDLTGIATFQTVALRRFYVAPIHQPGGVTMNQRRTRNLLLLMIAALLTLAVSLASADPNSGELTGASRAIGSKGGAGTLTNHASLRSNPTTAVALAGSRAQARSAIASSQSGASTPMPSASDPQDPRYAVTEPRECDLLHGIASSCIFN